MIFIGMGLFAFGFAACVGRASWTLWMPYLLSGTIILLSLR